MKRILDFTVALLALLFLSPVLIALAIAVKLTSAGPVFFHQHRLGLQGTPFGLIKFRSMRINAPDIRNADGSTFSSRDDPRVTALGRWMRATSLDELPQLINVLWGEMSLVGPRPDQADQLRFYTKAERRKLSVLPGLTGLAQISGRNSISWAARKALDLEYVETRSLALDCKILLKTIPYVLLRRDIQTDVRPSALGQ